MITRLALAGRRWLSETSDAADRLASHLTAFGERWLSDAHVRDDEPEFWIAFRQALFIGVPAILIGIGLMALLP